MSNIEQVKIKIKEGKLDEAMAMAMVEAMKLEIITATNSADNSSACHTSLDLLENEIEHELGDSTLEDFHFSEVENAHNKILQNVQSLQKMFALLQDNLDQLSK